MLSFKEDDGRVSPVQWPTRLLIERLPYLTPHLVGRRTSWFIARYNIRHQS